MADSFKVAGVGYVWPPRLMIYTPALNVKLWRKLSAPVGWRKSSNCAA